MIDMVVVLVLMGTGLSMTGPLSRRVVARYELNSAAQTLAADLAQAKIRAIQSNAISTVRLESNRRYRASGYPRELPGLVRFDAGSADSVAFNGLGAVTDGTAHVFILTGPYESREVRIYAAGGYEVRKL